MIGPETLEEPAHCVRPSGGTSPLVRPWSDVLMVCAPPGPAHTDPHYERVFLLDPQYQNPAALRNKLPELSQSAEASGDLSFIRRSTPSGSVILRPLERRPRRSRSVVSAELSPWTSTCMSMSPHERFPLEFCLFASISVSSAASHWSEFWSSVPVVQSACCPRQMSSQCMSV